MTSFRALTTIVLIASALIACGAHNHRQHHHDSGDHATSHRSFDEVERWARVFEDPERDGWQRPEEVIRRLELKPHDVVWDVGSATGYFPVRFARAIPQGRVVGADIEPKMADYLNQRARDEGLANLTSVTAALDHPGIEGEANVIFLCNTYHHIGGRIDYFRRLAGSLKPGGRVAVVDWKPGELEMGPPPDHKLAPEKIVGEMEEAGFRLLKRWDGLAYQYLLIFGLQP